MNNLKKLFINPLKRDLLRYVSVSGKQGVLLPGSSICRNQSHKAEKMNEEDNQPVKYSTSAARKFKARSALRNENNRLWYEPEVIVASLAIFLIYFLVLREENDIDEGIFMPLHKRIVGLEEVQLKSVIEHSKNSEEIAAAQQRIREIENEKL